jgi:hypothetical protein
MSKVPQSFRHPTQKPNAVSKREEPSTDGRRKADLFGGDVLLDGGDSTNGSDGQQIHTNDERADGHVLLAHLQPSSRCCTEIDHTLAATEEIIFLVQLDQLEGSTRAVSLLFGQMIELIMACFLPGPSSLLVVRRHGSNGDCG